MNPVKPEGLTSWGDLAELAFAVYPEPRKGATGGKQHVTEYSTQAQACGRGSVSMYRTFAAAASQHPAQQHIFSTGVCWLQLRAGVPFGQGAFCM